MESQTPVTEAPVTDPLKTQEVQNSLGAITAIEGLFHAINGSAIPLRYHDAVMSGMNFLAELHKNLLGKLPPGVLETIRKQQANPASVPAPAATPEATHEQPK